VELAIVGFPRPSSSNPDKLAILTGVKMRAWILTIQMLQGIGLVDIPKQSQFQKFDPSDLIFQAYDFPSYPNLEHLCKQRDDGVSGHMLTAYPVISLLAQVF